MLRNYIKFAYNLSGNQQRSIKLFRNSVNTYELRSQFHTTCFVRYNTKEDEKPSDLDRERKLKVLELEIDVSRQEGRQAPDPSMLKDEHWEHLLTLNTRSARRKYYSFLWQIEKKRESKLMKKEVRKEEVAARKAREKQQAEEEDHIIYGLGHTGFLLRIYDTTINHWNNNKLIQAMQFGQKLVFDCSYDTDMAQREAVNTAKQIMLSFAENRFHDEPFDLHFCNVDMQQTTMKFLHRHIPTMLEPSFPMNVHEKCFTELFPKEKLVYLTPHCRTDLYNYNHDDIYIIGCIVDKINNEPLSLAKAKRLGLRMARLPLDKYLQWGQGSGKSLTLNQMTSILLDMKQKGDWNYALRHVPRRKVFDSSYSKNKKSSESRSPVKPINKEKKGNPFRNSVDFDELFNSESNKRRS